MIIFVIAQAIAPVCIVSEPVIEDLTSIEEAIVYIKEDLATIDDTMILLPAPIANKTVCPFVFKDMVYLEQERAAWNDSSQIILTNFKFVKDNLHLSSGDYRTEYGSTLSFCMYSYNARGTRVVCRGWW